MSDKADVKTGTLRIYMQSGSVIVLPRVVETTWKERGSVRSIKIEQGGESGGERLLVQSLDLNRVEAITWESGKG